MCFAVCTFMLCYVCTYIVYVKKLGIWAIMYLAICTVKHVLVHSECTYLCILFDGDVYYA